MRTWYEKAEQQLEEDLEAGLISQAEYRTEMRNLSEELRSQAEEEAARAYDNVMGGW